MDKVKLDFKNSFCCIIWGHSPPSIQFPGQSVIFPLDRLGVLPTPSFKVVLKDSHLGLWLDRKARHLRERRVGYTLEEKLGQGNQFRSDKDSV